MANSRAPWGLGLLAAVLLSSCVPAETEESRADAVSAPVIEEPVRIPPDWVLSPSPAPAELCKVLDGQPPEVHARPEGGQFNGVRVRSNVGFPLSFGTIPSKGEANLIVAMVAFQDAPAPNLTAEGFLAPQLEKMTQWSEYWSQGSFRYSFQMVDEWITLPLDHADYPVQPKVDGELARANSYFIAKEVLKALPTDLDYEAADGVLVYWSPGISEFDGDIGIHGNEGWDLPTPNGPKGMFFWSGNSWHYEDSGQMTAEVKRDHTWSFWLYLLLDGQGLHNHGPGNGWPNGLQQLQVANPEFSGAVIAWDAFKLGWIRDEQVHCIDPATLEEPERVLLTPLEVAGGDRRVIVIPIGPSDVVVIESRRPIGYSETWSAEKTGLLVYQVNPQIRELNAGVQGGCGDDPGFPKWAFHLYPDSFYTSQGDCREFSNVFVREGDTLTHNGLVITLEFSDDELDYVTVERVL